MTTIGIAVILERGHVLVGIRGPQSPLPGLAEFPGGKCEPGESPAACALRETLEETGLRVEIAEPLDQRVWTYPHGQVDLHFFLCRPGEPVDLDQPYQSFRWHPVSDLRAMSFPEANTPAIDRLLTIALHRQPTGDGNHGLL